MLDEIARVTSIEVAIRAERTGTDDSRGQKLERIMGESCAKLK